MGLEMLGKDWQGTLQGSQNRESLQPHQPCSTASHHESESLLPRDRGTLRGAVTKVEGPFVPICVLWSVLESGRLLRYHFLLLDLSDLPTLPLSSRLADIVFSILDAYCVQCCVCRYLGTCTMWFSASV